LLVVGAVALEVLFQGGGLKSHVLVAGVLWVSLVEPGTDIALLDLLRVFSMTGPVQ